MVLVQTLSFFQLFFFRQNRPGKCLLRYSRAIKRLSTLSKQEVQKVEKLTFFYAIKTRSSKNRKIDIFSKGLTHGFGPTLSFFQLFFFLGKIGQENVFYDILER